MKGNKIFLNLYILFSQIPYVCWFCLLCLHTWIWQSCMSFGNFQCFLRKTERAVIGVTDRFPCLKRSSANINITTYSSAEHLSPEGAVLVLFLLVSSVMYLNQYFDWEDAVPWAQMLYKLWTCVEDAGAERHGSGKDSVSRHWVGNRQFSGNITSSFIHRHYHSSSTPRCLSVWHSL